MTGYDLAKTSGLPVIIGADNRYDFRRGRIVLQQSVATGSDPWALLVAAHELAHTRQPMWLLWLAWFGPAHWWLEMKAWQAAIRLVMTTVPR